MTDVEALREFVAANLTLLSAKELDTKEFKKNYRIYFIDTHKKKFGIPTNSDLARALISLLKQRGVQTSAVLAILDGARFFLQLAEAIRIELRDLTTGKSVTPVLADADIALVRTVGAFEAARQIKAREIEDSAQERLAELDKQIDQKRSEYDALPSVLDSAEIPEPEFIPDIEDNKAWWERFYLRADPFARKDGLSAISEDLYDQVIIRTRPFQDTLAGLQKTPDYLFNTGFLLSGGFGCGKTTYIDYLSYILVGKDILPIRIACGRAMADSAAFADSLYQRLLKEFRAEAIKIALMSPTEVLDLEPEDQLIELARRINSRRNGIVVFLDDYHKHRSHFPQIFEFLGTLQVLKDSFTRATTNVGFIVSGLPEWKAELSRNGQLSGFLDQAPIEMPDVTSDLVCDVFNRRIKAFCYEKTPRLLKETFVERLVQESQGHAGLRDYLTKIVSELSSNNQAIVDTPVEIPTAHLADVRSRFEADPIVKLSFNKLLYETKFKQLGQRQIEKCLELLVSVALQNGIAEDTLQFRDNRFYFLTLRDCGLIRKQSSKRGICEWNLSPKIKGIVSAIESELGYGMADYLLKLFAYKGYDARRNAEQPAELLEALDLRRLLGRREVALDRSVIDHLQKGLQYVETFLGQPTKRKSESHPSI